MFLAAIDAAMARPLLTSDEMQQAVLGMHPIGRMDGPEEIAQAAIWLCSDAASFMVGHALAVDGGFTAR